jgi:hypothetical protein
MVDTDGDGLSDWDELNVHGTDPTNWDSDGDRQSDGYELNVLGTNPNNWDTDGDGVPDGIGPIIPVYPDEQEVGYAPATQRDITQYQNYQTAPEEEEYIDTSEHTFAYN